MRNFLLGFLLAILCAGAAYLLEVRRSQPDPCAACGAGTRCESRMCVSEGDRERAPRPQKKRAGSRQRRTDEGTAEPPPIMLSEAERRPVSSGDNLGRSEVIDLTRVPDTERELSQDDLDAVFRARQDEILGCLDAARGEAQLDGRMTVSFRVRREGTVAGVRVEAPSYLMARGLYTCVRKVVMGLRFPASGASQIVSYPFSLRLSSK